MTDEKIIRAAAEALLRQEYPQGGELFTWQAYTGDARAVLAAVEPLIRADQDRMTREQVAADSHVEWGRAFWTDKGERLFVDDEGAFRDFEDAAQHTKLGWSESPYDFVVSRDVSDWRIAQEAADHD